MCVYIYILLIVSSIIGFCKILNIVLCAIFILVYLFLYDFPGGSDGKASVYNAETQVQSLGREDPLEKEMAIHSTTIAWKIPWTEEPGRLQSMGIPL